MLPNASTPLFRRIDWILVGLYFLLIVTGWFSICGASFSLETASLFESGSRPAMQLVWMGLSGVLILLILLSDVGWFETFAPIFYILMMGLLFVTIFIAPDIKGSHSWLVLGSMRLQPAEFAKIATSLMLASALNRYKFKLNSFRAYAEVFVIVLLPMMLIFLQKEAGSALVYTALFLALYREGLSGIFLGLAFIAVVLFVMALSLADVFWGATQADYWALSTVITVAIFIALALNPKRNSRLFSWGIGGYIGVYASALLVNYFFPFDLSYIAIIILVALIVYCLWIAVKLFARHYLITALFAVGCVVYSLSVSFVFENVLQPHQRGRIAVALGLKEDLKGMGYNVNQAKIAIGSGGLTGKGFLKGTQTKLSYVPEQDTDFIFCTVGEEHGFIGSTALLLIYLALILRFFYLAERQVNAFGRVYGYCVGSIFLFHLAVNVGMVLGIVPVIGIPLPFFSYGGSSLWGFTILLFIFVRIDADRKRGRSKSLS
ncbi:MAG: rod shape-determining protein RodA [Bacteroidales bacterium]|nr:rod shape-determining protein RodA [Porphyromonas sp.]MDD6933993.1 rod shape-determining protein RodA [Bacteroidales bacterium]